MEKTVLCVIKKVEHVLNIIEYRRWFLCDSEKKLNEYVLNFKGWEVDGKHLGYEFKGYTIDDILGLTMWELRGMTALQFLMITKNIDIKYL